MYKASTVDDATGPSCSEVGGAETSTYMDGAGTIDDNGPGEAEGKIDIVAGEKQAYANSEIYYAIYPSENGSPTMPNKTNKILILISS